MVAESVNNNKSVIKYSRDWLRMKKINCSQKLKHCFSSYMCRTWVYSVTTLKIFAENSGLPFIFQEKLRTEGPARLSVFELASCILASGKGFTSWTLASHIRQSHHYHYSHFLRRHMNRSNKRSTSRLQMSCLLMATARAWKLK